MNFMSLIPTKNLPTLIEDMPNHVYHADPVEGGSLSSTGARTILWECPREYHWRQQHPEPPKLAFDLGSAAHSLVLGVGAQPVEIPAGLLSTNGAASTAEAKQFIVDAQADNRIPLKPQDMETVKAMAQALSRHPIMGKLLGGTGLPEASLFWKDPESGVSCRARLDWLPTVKSGQRAIIIDYKTSVSANPRVWSRKAAEYRYNQQGAWYEDAVVACGLAEEVAFVWVVQSKSAPYTVTVFQLDYVAMDLGRQLNRRARSIFAECKESGHWPGYSRDVELVHFPEYALRDMEMMLGGKENL